MRRLFAYLTGERCIDWDVLPAFTHAGLIYEDAEFHNAIFVGTVFEAPIDLPAYISMHSDGWEQHSYVALCSTADCVALWMLKAYPHLKSVYLCLDHDFGLYDENGKPMHIQKRSTNPSSDFKGNALGSHPDYSFHYVGKSEKLFEWGIEFEEPYTVPLRANGVTVYADHQKLTDAILKKYPPKEEEPTEEKNSSNDILVPDSMSEQNHGEQSHVKQVPKKQQSKRIKEERG